MTDRPAFVLLEDGTWYAGTTPRPVDSAFGEVVFTTNLSGYQEVFTDPSYLGQLVVKTTSAQVESKGSGAVPGNQAPSSRST